MDPLRSLEKLQSLKAENVTEQSLLLRSVESISNQIDRVSELQTLVKALRAEMIKQKHGPQEFILILDSHLLSIDFRLSELDTQHRQLIQESSDKRVRITTLQQQCRKMDAGIQKMLPQAKQAFERISKRATAQI